MAVYSVSLALESTSGAANITYEGPAGNTTIVRSITGVLLVEDSGQILVQINGVYVLAVPSLKPNAAESGVMDWEGRIVVPPGGVLTLSTTSSMGVQASGYSLTS